MTCSSVSDVKMLFGWLFLGLLVTLAYDGLCRGWRGYVTMLARLLEMSYLRRQLKKLKPVMAGWLLACWLLVKRDKRALCWGYHRQFWGLESELIPSNGKMFGFYRCRQCSMLWFTSEGGA